MNKILVTGATGQIGSELVPALQKKYGSENIVITTYRKEFSQEVLQNSSQEIFEATDKEKLNKIIKKHNIDTIFHLVGVLSAKGEKNPDLAWKTNMESLKHILDLGVKYDNFNGYSWML